jgi:hypothetical protein
MTAAAVGIINIESDQMDSSGVQSPIGGVSVIAVMTDGAGRDAEGEKWSRE